MDVNVSQLEVNVSQPPPSAPAETGVELAVVYFGLILSVLNTLLTIVGGIRTYRTNVLHRNCKFLAYSAFFGFLLVSCGDLSISLTLISSTCPLPVIAQFTAPDADCQLQQKLCRVVMFYGIILVVFAMLVTCFERTCATYYVDYERRKYSRLGAGFQLLAHALTVLSSLAYWSWGLSHLQQCCSMIVVNLVAFVYASVLRRQNKKSNTVKKALDDHLSRRYQLTENLRILELIYPCLLLSTVCIGTVTAALAYMQYTFLWRISIMLYYLLLNVYMTACLCLLGRSWLRERLCHRNAVKDVRVDKDSMDGHFKALNSMWQ